MKVIVGMADLKVSDESSVQLVTYALGSCLGITVYDPEVKVAGMLHVMMPESAVDEDKARARPDMFMDTGVPRLFKECYALGAAKKRMIVLVAGGASTRTTADDHFQIGKRNFTALRKILWRNGVLLKRYDVGGCLSRTMILDVATGEVKLKTNGTTKTL